MDDDLALAKNLVFHLNQYLTFLDKVNISMK